MKPGWKFAVRLAIVGCAVYGLMFASPVPPLDIETLTSKAAVIAVGRVVSVSAGVATTIRSPYISEPFPGHEFTARLETESILKGQVGGGALKFRYMLPDAPVGYRGIGAGQFGVFFLRESNGGFEILDPYHPFVVAAPGLGPATGSLANQVVAEVAHVLAYPGSTGEMRMEAVTTLQSVGTPTATAALKAAAGGPDVRSRVLALAALLERGNMSALPAVKEIALSSPEATDNDLMPGIGVALRSVRSTKAIPSLNDLLQAPNVWVRRGAAAALRNTRSPKAIVPLSKALYDMDREVRYYAVVGLGEFTGQNQWTPSIANFNQNEKKFVDHWRDWARAQGYAPSQPKP